MASSVGTAETYYQALDTQRHEIRILCVLPSMDGDSEICCELEARSLDDSPTYDALSYCWGMENEGPIIDIMGEKVAIKPNLFAALKQLRHENKKLRLWVDAICINQSDKEEKKDQVSMMDLVYRGAKIVYAWLGEEGDGSAHAMALLQILQKIFFEEFNIDELQVIRSEMFAVGWKALIPLLRRPYWMRAWIVQEVLLSENVMVCCGRHKVAWPTFSVFLHIVQGWSSEALWSSDEGNLVQSALHSLSYLVQELSLLFQLLLKYQKLLLVSEGNQQSRGGRLDLLDCLTMSRRRLAADERDHVYSILSLTDITFLEPNYQKSTQWLFQEVVVRDIQARGNLAVLCGCKHFSEEERNYSQFSRAAKLDLDRNELLSRELELHKGSSACCSPGESWTLGQHPIWYEKTSDCLDVWYETLMKMARDAGNEDLGHEDPQSTTKYSFKMLSSAFGRMREYGRKRNSPQALHRVHEFEDLLRRFCKGHRQHILGQVLNASLPTWVPNWTLPVSSLDQNILLHDGSRDKYLSARSTIPQISFDNERKSMTLKAILVDEISRVPRFQRATAEDPLKRYWDFWLDAGKAQEIPYKDRCGQREAFRSLLTLGREVLSLDTLQLVILAEPQSDQDQRFVSMTEMQREALSIYKNWIGEANRQFFITRSGYIGAGPTAVQEDDLVVIPFGSNVPFILRPNGNFFYLVEECYVQGIMKGEMFEQQDGISQVCREFCIV